MNIGKFKQIIVLKFGGSVLENESSIRRAAELVRKSNKEGSAVVVVVSAMKGVTDQLLTLSKKVNPSMQPPLLDELLASGERTSARLMAAALARYGLNPVVVDPDTPHWPIITDGRHLDANPILELSRKRAAERLIPILERGQVPVVCGFLGKTTIGRITTLGRGGSDTTAVLLGNLLNAKEVILVKDVDGVFTSDPDKVSNPHLIDSLSKEEAEQLAAGGAKFLHSKALRYIGNGMRIRVTSLQKITSGTVIKGEADGRSVELLQDNVTMVTIVGIKEASSVLGFFADAIREAEGKLLAVSAESSSAILYVSGGRGLLDRIHKIMVERQAGKAVSSFEELAMITVRGSSLETESGVVQMITAPLAEQRINLYGVITILSSVRVFVSRPQAETARQLIEDAIRRGRA